MSSDITATTSAFCVLHRYHYPHCRNSFKESFYNCALQFSFCVHLSFQISKLYFLLFWQKKGGYKNHFYFKICLTRRMNIICRLKCASKVMKELRLK